MTITVRYFLKNASKLPKMQSILQNNNGEMWEDRNSKNLGC